jgi:heat shock protein 4
MYQRDLPESADQKVAFVDFGDSALQCSIISFSKTGMKVLSSTYDRSLGGRDFDRTLATHFAVEIKQKYKIDVLSNPRALIRLLIGCEKTKKILSANPQAPLHVPCIMDDIDVSLMIKRQDFETIAAPLFDRIRKPLEDALKQANLTAADIHAVEQIGGSVRVPRVIEVIKDVFGKDPGRRLNSEECIAKVTIYLPCLSNFLSYFPVIPI